MCMMTKKKKMMMIMMTVFRCCAAKVHHQGFSYDDGHVVSLAVDNTYYTWGGREGGRERERERETKVLTIMMGRNWKRLLLL